MERVKGREYTPWCNVGSRGASRGGYGVCMISNRPSVSCVSMPAVVPYDVASRSDVVAVACSHAECGYSSVEAHLLAGVAGEVPRVNATHVYGPGVLPHADHIPEGDVVPAEAVGNEPPGNTTSRAPDLLLRGRRCTFPYGWHVARQYEPDGKVHHGNHM